MDFDAVFDVVEEMGLVIRNPKLNLIRNSRGSEFMNVYEILIQ